VGSKGQPHHGHFRRRHQAASRHFATNARGTALAPAIVTGGHVINGQHRLAAASDTDWNEVENDPLFLVIFGVDPEEAILADMSKRTARDQSTIAVKVLAAR
jgi:hypothetical protein